MAITLGTGTSLGGLAGGAATARLIVAVSGNTAGLQASLAAGAKSLAGFNANASALGGAMMRSLTLPLLGIGGASIRMAADFEAGMARIRGLTPLTFNEVAEAEERIIELSKELPTAPRELADALYFAGSAGLTFSEAMQTVELSAKGAAIGMGDANDIAKVLIFALNSYRKTGLDAAGAMDALTVAIKEGTAEPDEMAIALGRLIPIAQAAGISFEDVVASVASLTNIGLPTRVATTSLRALFTELLAPTERAKQNLDELGLSANRLRAALRAGPIAALELLMEVTDGNIDQLKAVAPQIRGFTALLGLTGDQAMEVTQNFREVQNSTGALDKAFAEISKTTSFKFGVALNEVRIAGIELGQALFPVFAQVIRTVSAVGKTFSDLPGPVKAASAAMLTLLAAAGPLIKIWGALVASGAGLFTNFRSIATGLAVMSAAALAAIGGFSNLASGSLSLGNQLMTLIGTTLAVGLAIRGLAAAANAGLLGVNALSLGLVGLGPGVIAGIAVGIGLLTAAIATSIGKMNEMGKAAGSLADHLTGLGVSAVINERLLRDLEDNRVADAFREAAKEAGVFGANLSEGLPKVREQFTETAADVAQALSSLSFAEVGGVRAEQDIQALAGALEQLRGRAVDIAPALERLGVDVSSVKSSLRGVGPEAKGLANQLLDVVYASGSASQVHRDLEAQNQALFASFVAGEDAAQRWADEYGVSAEAIKRGAAELGGVNLVALDQESADEFASILGYVDETTGEHIENQKAAAEAEAEIRKKRAESLADTSLKSIFEEEADSIEDSTAKLISNMNTQTNQAVKFATNIRTLMKRGLDPSILQFLVDQGPAMVGKFVDATDGQLRRLETNYHTTLGAVDAAILNEGAHQEVKGRGVVQRFARGMLSNSALPPAAAAQIVGQVTDAFAQGDMNTAGLKAIQDFANAIKAMEGLPKGAAAEIIKAFVNQLTSGNFDGAGQEDVEAFAKGIARKTGVPKAKAQAIATAVKGALNISGVTSGLGGAAADSFANAMAARRDRAYQAGLSVGRAAAQGMKDGSKGSPRLFSWYLGRDIVDEFNEGLRSKMVSTHLPMPIWGGGRNVGGPGVGGGPIIFDLRNSIVTSSKDMDRLAAKLSGPVLTQLRRKQSRNPRQILGTPG